MFLFISFRNYAFECKKNKTVILLSAPSAAAALGADNKINKLFFAIQANLPHHLGNVFLHLFQP